MPSWAADIFQTPEAFIEESFAGKPPVKQTLTIDEKTMESVHEIMGDHYQLSQADYWLKDGRSAWILEAIGKVKPITTGFIVAGNKLEKVKVLIYRESHGWEVKYPFFTDQFKEKELDIDYMELDGYIDNISGATLSVKSLTRKAALALFLHQQVTPNE